MARHLSPVKRSEAPCSSCHRGVIQRWHCQIFWVFQNKSEFWIFWVLLKKYAVSWLLNAATPLSPQKKHCVRQTENFSTTEKQKAGWASSRQREGGGTESRGSKRQVLSANSPLPTHARSLPWARKLEWICSQLPPLWTHLLPVSPSFTQAQPHGPSCHSSNTPNSFPHSTTVDSRFVFSQICMLMP